LRYLAKALTADDSPRQLALGFALGIAVGLIPKGNLTAVTLTVVLFASRVNVGAGMVSAFLFSWVGSLLDPVSHAIGLSLLTSTPLQPLLSRVFDLPIVPWTSLNNTVVLGSLILGAAQFYFSYRLSKPVFARYQPVVVGRLAKYKVAHVLLGSDVASGWRLG
jgi:uncharacterized protein (TIGR03546 family)